jgi:hypothetical protein
MENEIQGMRTRTEQGRDQILLLHQKGVLDLFLTYFHEVGHVISNRYSFLEGDVLSPRDAERASVKISGKELATLIILLSAHKVPFLKFKMKGTIKGIADRILTAYTKDKWDPKSIELGHASEKKIKKIILEKDNGDIKTAHIDSQFNVTFKNSREGRDAEVPPIAVEKACMKILENSLLASFSYPEQNDQYKRSSHGRAHRVVETIFKKGWMIPSQLDMQKRK